MKNYEWFAEKTDQAKAILLNSLACQQSFDIVDFGIAKNNIAFCDNKDVICVSGEIEKENFCQKCIFTKPCKESKKLELVEAKILWLAADHKE